jgi:hypothetical protein
MLDPDIRKQLSPIRRSWPWFLATGGGLVAFGLITAIYTLFVATVVGTHDLAYFWEIFNFPVGVLGVLSGYQLIRIARHLAAPQGGEGVHNVAEFSRRMRLAVILGGAMSLLLLFEYMLAIVRQVVPPP